MGFIHCEISTSIWVVAFIALLTIGPAGGQPCVDNRDVKNSVETLTANAQLGGHLAYHVETRPQDDDPNIMYKGHKSMFPTLDDFKNIWREWKTSTKPKVRCDPPVGNVIPDVKEECFDISQRRNKLKYRTCHVALQKTCPVKCGPFNGRSVKFVYAYMKPLNGNNGHWTLLSSYIYETTTCALQ